MIENIDEWFGSRADDYNVSVADGVLRVTRYNVTNGQTDTTNGETVLCIRLGAGN